MKFTNEKLNAKLAKHEALKVDFIKAENLTKKEIEQYNAALKEVKRLAKIDSLKLEKCQIDYNGQTVPFKPSLTLVDGKEVVIWKTLDKNACYVASDNDGKVNLNAVPACSKKSSVYNIRMKEVKANSKLVNGLLNQVFNGMDWAAFITRIKGYKNIKTVATPNYLK